MALIAELQPVAFSPFSRILSTVSFNWACVGDSVGSHLRTWLYHETVDGDMFCR